MSAFDVLTQQQEFLRCLYHAVVTVNFIAGKINECHDGS